MATPRILIFFFFNDTATTEIYTLSLHDALPISNFSFLGVRRRAEKALFGGGHAFRIGAGWDLSKKFRKKRIELGYLDLVISAANFHINRLSRESRAGDTRAIAAHKALHARASRSTKLNALSGPPLAYGVRLFRAGNRRPAETPL